MDKFYPPNFIGYIPLPDGKPAAGGTLIACRTGTDILAPIYDENGVRIDGSALQIDSHGQARFLIDPSITYRIKIIMPPDDILNPTAVYDNVRVGPGGDGGGMENPMTAKGDIIVGGTDGEAERLGVGADGDILSSALYGGGLSPKWEAGPKKYRNVFSSVPSPIIDDGYLGCLFYLSGSAQNLELPATANIPEKSFIDFVFLDDTTTLTITPQGGSVLNTQSSSITIGGKSATFYRLTFLGRGDIGGVPTDQWAVGGSVLPDGKVIAATGDATRGTLNAKINPESPLTKEVETDIHGVKTLKLALDLGNDEDVLTTEEDALGNKSALWKPPSGKLKVTSADTLADYLGAKLVQGTGITIIPQTDGDGVQTLEISATGGGGGGSDWDIVEPLQMRHKSLGAQFGLIMRAFYPLGPSVRSLAIALGPFQNSYYPGGTLNGEIGIYTLSPKTNGSLVENNATRIAHKSFSQTIVSPIVWVSFDADVDVSDKTKVYAAAVSFDRPVVNFYPYLILSSFGTTGSTAYIGTHMTSSSHIALASSMNFNQGGTGDITYWFGISSRNLG